MVVLLQISDVANLALSLAAGQCVLLASVETLATPCRTAVFAVPTPDAVQFFFDILASFAAA